MSQTGGSGFDSCCFLLTYAIRRSKHRFGKTCSTPQAAGSLTPLTRGAALGHSAPSKQFAANICIRISVGGYHTCLSRREQGFESPIRKNCIAFCSPPTHNVAMTDDSTSRVPLTICVMLIGGGVCPPFHEISNTADSGWFGLDLSARLSSLPFTDLLGPGQPMQALDMM